MAIDPRFFMFEILSIILFCLCLRHALQRDKSLRAYYVIELVCAVAFGLFAEIIGINYFHVYLYGHFFFMVFSVPVSIGLMWGVIIYICMLTSDCWGIPKYIAPFADILQALNIDMSMDIVAQKLGMWSFTPGVLRLSPELWFGVPYVNFYGWALIVLLFSSISRILRGVMLSRISALIKLVVISMIIVLFREVILFSILTIGTLEQIQFFFIAIVIMSIIVVAFSIPWIHKSQTRPLIIPFVPASIHLFFIALFFTLPPPMNWQILAVMATLFGMRVFFDLWLFEKLPRLNARR